MSKITVKQHRKPTTGYRILRDGEIVKFITGQTCFRHRKDAETVAYWMQKDQHKGKVA